LKQLQTTDGQQYDLTVIDDGGQYVICRVTEGHHRVIAKARYDKLGVMITSLWVLAAYRRRGLAHALVKFLWDQYPEARGRYPQLRMSHEMHGFLTSLMRREGVPDCAPGLDLRGMPDGTRSM
jgi:GNAT superfamily N-acetyltransferase